jgi:hypothetical protein
MSGSGAEREEVLAAAFVDVRDKDEDEDDDVPPPSRGGGPPAYVDRAYPTSSKL